MGNMTGSDVIPGRITVRLLVIEEDVGVESLQKLALVQPPEKQRFIDTDIPCPQCLDHPFVGRGRTRRYQASSQWCLAYRESHLDLLQCGQYGLERLSLIHI